MPVTTFSTSDTLSTKDALSELYRYRGLLYAIIQRDIRIKYKQSVMGFMWAILMPLLIVMVGVLVRFAYSRASNSDMALADVAGVAIKSVPWAFTVASIRFSSTSLLSNVNLVTKIYFPKEVFPLAAVGSNLFDLAIASVPLLVIIVLSGATFTIHLLWVPLLVAILIMFVSGIAMLISAASLFFRDVKYLVEIALTFGIFVTPVFFGTAMFGEYGVYMKLNPLSSLFEGLETTVLHGAPPDIPWVAYSTILSFIGLIGGYVFFKKLEPAFAENI